jgi:acyl-CoA synthetase (AMP-forming)/AMP-acid ligase II
MATLAPRNLGDVIPRAGAPDAPWLIEVAEDGKELSVSFAELQAAADAIAGALTARGLRRGSAIGILAQNSARYLMAYYGIMRAGFVAVPINFKAGNDTIAHIVGDAGIQLVLTDAERRSLVPDAVPLLAIDDDATWGALVTAPPIAPVAMKDEELALILYTSGSSGRPKGVPLTHGGYLWATDVLSRSGPPMRGKRALVAAPYYHMNGLLHSMLIGMAGGTVVLLTRFSAVPYLEAIARHRCGIITSVPTMLALIARETATLARLDLSSVELVVTGSAPSTETLIDRMAEIFPNGKVVNGWGTTESSPVAFGPHPQGLPRPKMSIGYPMAEAEWRLVGGPDADQGVLQVRNRALMPGYLNLPAETAARLKEGWYDTGDIFRRDENGFFYFVSRADDMFTCGAENIYPSEVERMLERHPAVAQAAVVPVSDPIKHALPAAFIVLKRGAVASADDIKEFALRNGPAYRHPRFVEFVEELPLAGTNKVDRKALVARAATFQR